jgi:hypothetical protein
MISTHKTIYVETSNDGYQIREEWASLVKESTVLKGLQGHGISKYLSSICFSLFMLGSPSLSSVQSCLYTTVKEIISPTN